MIYPVCIDISRSYIQAVTDIIVALAKIFGIATGYEYALKLAPPSVRSLVMAMFLSTAAISALLGIIIASLYVDPMLVWVYSGLTRLSGVAFWAAFGGRDVQKHAAHT